MNSNYRRIVIKEKLGLTRSMAFLYEENSLLFLFIKKCYFIDIKKYGNIKMFLGYYRKRYGIVRVK
jgi:hypothetical protein